MPTSMLLHPEIVFTYKVDVMKHHVPSHDESFLFFTTLAHHPTALPEANFWQLLLWLISWAGERAARGQSKGNGNRELSISHSFIGAICRPYEEEPGKRSNEGGREIFEKRVCILS